MTLPIAAGTAACLRRAACGLALLAGALPLCAAWGAEPVQALAAQRAASCVTCHGAARPIAGSDIPMLAGMPARRIEQAMHDYAARAATGGLMGQIARGYDARTVALIAQWYASLVPEEK